MKRTLARLATLALAAPLAVAGLGGSAQAATSVTVPGCYGALADRLIVCNVTVTVTNPTAELYQVGLKVCVGTCYIVPVTLARPADPGSVCYSWTDGLGRPYGGCAVDTGQLESVEPVTNVCLTIANMCHVEE